MPRAKQSARQDRAYLDLVEKPLEAQSAAETVLARSRRSFVLATRIGLLVTLAGYGLDLILSQLVLPGSGLEATMGVSSLPSENPDATMSFLSFALLALGHLLFGFALAMWVLGSPGFWERLKTEGADRFALSVGAVGLLGLLALWAGGRRIISTLSLTYVDLLGLDLFALLAIAVVCWVKLAGQRLEPVRQKLVFIAGAGVVTGLTTTAVSTEHPWLVVVFGTATVLAWSRASQLLTFFETGEGAGPSQAAGL